MPFNPAVHLHSIVGTGKLSPVGEPGDGVVDVSSARCRGVDSELFVPAQHEKLHRDPESIAEMARILRLHARECLVARGPAGGGPLIRRPSPFFVEPRPANRYTA